MKLLCELVGVASDDELFSLITGTFKEKITQWSYFVNWKKVLENVAPIEKELNLLNCLVGKCNIKEETEKLIAEYPNVIKTFPILLAVRDNSLEVLIDTKRFLYKQFDFRSRQLSEDEISDLVDFLIKSGFAELIENQRVKNIVDYVTGVEVGLDSNGRKNRGGKLMETLVEEFVMDAWQALGFDYMSQATAKKIKAKWNIDIKADKSSRRVDFAVNKKGKLFFIEVNFYGGGGSKLKSTATEYARMNEYWNRQGIEFIWVTDGAGWRSTLKPLREYFDSAKYLLNLEMLKNGVLKEILT